MHPLSYFDRVFIINLRTRADRRREIERQLKGVGVSLSTTGIELFPAERPSDAGDFDSVGARGCFLSHLGVLRAARERGYSRVLILEDDVNFAPQFNRRLAGHVASLSRVPWDLFYGGYRIAEGHKPEGETPTVPPDLNIVTAHFIALRDPAITAATAFFERLLSRPSGHPAGGPMHVDGAYSWLRRGNPHFVTRLAVPELAYQRSSRTDIHDLGWCDRLPMVRHAIAAARVANNQLKAMRLLVRARFATLAEQPATAVAIVPARLDQAETPETL